MELDTVLTAQLLLATPYLKNYRTKIQILSYSAPKPLGEAIYVSTRR